MLSLNGCITLEGVDDADRFKAIQDAFTTVGVDSDAQLQVGDNVIEVEVGQNTT